MEQQVTTPRPLDGSFWLLTMASVMLALLGVYGLIATGAHPMYPVGLIVFGFSGALRAVTMYTGNRHYRDAGNVLVGIVAGWMIFPHLF